MCQFPHGRLRRLCCNLSMGLVKRTICEHLVLSGPLWQSFNSSTIGDRRSRTRYFAHMVLYFFHVVLYFVYVVRHPLQGVVVFLCT